MTASRHAELVIEGMTCASCVARVTNALKNVPGVERAQVNLATERATVDVDDAVADTALIAAVERVGYGAAVPAAHEDPVDADAQRRDRELRRKRGMLIVAVALFVPTLALGMFVPAFPYKDWLMLALTLPVWAIPGWDFHRGALAQLRHGSANMDTLVSLGSSVALLYSLYATLVKQPTYYETASAIVTLIFIGKYLETLAKGETNSAIRSLVKLRPDVARVRRGGDVAMVPVEEVRVGDEIVVPAGERVPVDGTVIEGASAIDVSMLTGESIPRDVIARDDVSAGTVNGSGSLVIRATAVGSGTTLARIVEIVRRAQGSTPPVQRLADRIASIFVPSILAIAALTFVAWLSFGSWVHALVTAVAVIVVACPCALGLATPTAIMVAAGTGARKGVLFKDAEALERLAAVDVVIFDKTGTLTEGKPRVVAVEGDEDRALSLAAALEAHSSHPLAQAIVDYARERSVVSPEATTVTAIAGGLRGNVDGASVLAGNAALMARENVVVSQAADAATRVYVACDGVLAGAIELADEPRAHAKRTVADLRSRGDDVWLASGDVAPVVESIARAVGIEHTLAHALPQEKAALVERLRGEGRVSAFVGDGINDAPALAVADVGIAMGGGTQIAMETAKAAILSNDPLAVVTAIDLAHATLRTIRQNLFWAFAYNVVLVPLAAFGIVSPIFAAAAMGASSVFVVTNSLLLRRRVPS